MDKGRTWRRTLPRIYLDGTLLDYEDTDRDATVGDLVEAVEKEIRGMKRLIRDLYGWKKDNQGYVFSVDV